VEQILVVSLAELVYIVHFFEVLLSYLWCSFLLSVFCLVSFLLVKKDL